MAARKPKPVVVEPLEAEPIPVAIDIVTVTKARLESAVRANMQFKTGSLPVEGQFEDLWRRLTQD